MMFRKAQLFGDEQVAAAILEASTPKEAKALGRQVKNYDDELWSSCARAIVEDILRLKFTQNKELGNYLLSTGSAIIAEASPYDKRWGIGLSASQAAKTPPDQWPGTNWLGLILMSVREHLAQQRKDDDE